jgi:PelA/Pel-15E family pectate lyase
MNISSLPCRLLLLPLCAALAVPLLFARVVGQNWPAQSLTRERIAQLPVAERKAWLDYLSRSEQQRQIDKDALAAELKSAGLRAPLEPAHGHSAKSIPMDRDAAWYGSAEARRIAAIIVSFQTPAGGWGKNLDMSVEMRKPGMAWGPNNLNRYPTPLDFDAPREPGWNYIGTIDNDATTTELNYLARVISAGARETSYRAAFFHGIEYLLHAQYPNGGWPQVWPLEGGYHDAITFNDDAMTQVVELLRQTAQGEGDFQFVPQELRHKAQAAFERGVHCILIAQLHDRTGLTIWPQQSDALTLQPTSARNYELPTPCPSESTGILLLLMNDFPHPAAEVRQAIRAGMAYLKKTEIYGKSYTWGAAGRMLVDAPGAGPIWARYSDPESGSPVFGDRDKKIYDNVNEISRERRNGYGWYSDEPLRAEERFAAWSKEHPEKP